MCVCVRWLNDLCVGVLIVYLFVDSKRHSSNKLKINFILCLPCNWNSSYTTLFPSLICLCAQNTHLISSFYWKCNHKTADVSFYINFFFQFVFQLTDWLRLYNFENLKHTNMNHIVMCIYWLLRFRWKGKNCSNINK